MREIVIVIPDLYLPTSQDPTGSRNRASETPAPEAGSTDTSPALDAIARFGTREVLGDGWRAWLARWLGSEDIAATAPATVAARSIARVDAKAAWLATPLHLAAGLTTLHLDRRSILRVSSAELESLSADFDRTFRDSGLALCPLPSGEAILFCEAEGAAVTVEPARFVGEDIAAALPEGPAAPFLRRLGAEIEIWLHSHPVNRARAVRRELPLSTFWFWGGGPLAPATGSTAAPVAASTGAPPPGGRASISASGSTPTGPVALFGADAYLNGLGRLTGHKCHPLPDPLDSVFGYSPAASAVAVVEIGPMLQANSNWTLMDALGELDRRVVDPAVRALRSGSFARMHLIANDRLLTFGGRDHLRLWRRARPGLEGLR